MRNHGSTKAYIIIIDISMLMNIIKNFLSGQNITRNNLYLICFLISIIFLGYVIPTIVFLSPAGTDVYTHMFNTQRMVESNSLFEFYEKSFEQESLDYDYPFGLWFFGAIVIKVTGMDIHQLVYILPLFLSMVMVFIYYMYANYLLVSKNKAILSTIFLISMPLMALNMLQYATGRFISVILLYIIYISITKYDSRKFLIISMLVFSLIFTHTGTYMFLIFFCIVYFISSALIWKKFDKGIYITIVALLFLYVMAVALFPYVQPQYIDKGRMVLTISGSISSNLRLELVKEMGKIFYDKIFVANNLTYAIFWSCLIFAAGKFSIFFRSRIESIGNSNYLAIPIIGSIQSVSHGIVTAPFWMGPVQSFFSIFGIFKLDMKGKCIALSLALTSFFPGALQSDYGTGAIRELYYMFLIIPISSATGLCYFITVLNKKYSFNPIKNTFIMFTFLIVMLPIISAPIVGNLYYQPTISGSKSEKENLMWLSKIGQPSEGVPEFAYRERIDIYANKSTPSIPSGNKMRRYLNDLKYTYFSTGSEKYTEDLNLYNIKYIISSDRTIKGFGEKNSSSLKIDSNKQLDKIYSSVQNFGIYNYITPPTIVENSSSIGLEMEFDEASPKIQVFGSTYLVENDFYKIRLGEIAPDIKYLGTKTRNMLEEGGLSENIRIAWKGPYKGRYVWYSLNSLKYQDILVQDNKIQYKALVRDENNLENWATLIVKYTFYEKAIKKEIKIANDWVNFETDSGMDLWISSSIFAPISDFEFNQIEADDEKIKPKKMYPSQDAVILEDKKFNEIYFNESGTGLFIKYSDMNPYPTKISYKGSTASDYGSISMESSYSLSPSETMTMTRFISVGDKSTAKNNADDYTSISSYLYPEAKVPVILTGYNSGKSADGYSLDTYTKFQNYGVTYNEGITPTTKNTLREEVNPIGYVNLYEKGSYKNLSFQDDEIKKAKGLNVNGLIFKSYKFNMDSIKVLSNNNIQFAQALTVPSPFLEFSREGLRHPQTAYYHGTETGIVLIPVTLPGSSTLRPDYNVEKVFSQWKDTMDSVVEDGGMAVFLWEADDIGNPDYTDKFMELIDYSKTKGMSFMTPDEITNHFKLLNKISTNVTRGIDFFILNVSNDNPLEVKGITYKLNMPVLNYSCPYSSENARIYRPEIRETKCRIYVSLDLKAGEQKNIKIESNNNKGNFELDLSNVYDGNSLILVRDGDGKPVDKAIVYIDSRRLESNNKGEVNALIRRGLHKITVEKPGFVSKTNEIEVRGRIYKLFGFFKNSSRR